MGGIDEDRRQQDSGKVALPPGFQFKPTDAQLILDYLQPKRACPSFSAYGMVIDLDIYRYNPWDLPRHRFNYPEEVQSEMFFFTPTHTHGKGKLRCDRTAGDGVWHGHGKDKLITNLTGGAPVVIGHTTCFNFEMFPADDDHPATKTKRRVIKTDWLMHEFRLPSTTGDDEARLVLCKIYKKKKTNSSKSKLQEEEEMIQKGQALKRRRIAETISESPSPDGAEELLLLVAHAEEQKEVAFTADHLGWLRGMLVED